MPGCGWSHANVRCSCARKTSTGAIFHELAERLKKRGMVIVLSDHGKHDNTLEESRVTFHIVNGPAAARGGEEWAGGDGHTQ